MHPTIEALIQDVEELVALPEVCARVNRMADDPAIGIDHLAEAVTQDPALTAQLLRVANDPLHGVPGRVDTVAGAAELLGKERFRELALATTATHLFDGLPNELVSMHDFWRHSLFCALAARQLAPHSSLEAEREVLFTAGLLHDVGELLLFNRLPERAREALTLALDGVEEPEIHQAERRVIGFDHGEVGAALARRWGLPPMLSESIEFHHRPCDAPHHPGAAALIHIANAVACWAELNSHRREEAPPIQPEAWELTGLTHGQAHAAAESAREMIQGAEALFLDLSGSPASAALQRRDDSWVRLHERTG